MKELNNEIEKNSFSVSVDTNFEQIKDFNDQGWTANQNYLFKNARFSASPPTLS